jgi:hypothetical protein
MSFTTSRQDKETRHIHKAPFSAGLWAKMILTAPDVSDLSNALSWWERGEYFFSFVVAAACFGEYVADFKPQWYRTGDAERDEKRKESISKRSTLVLVAALVFELLCVARSNTLAGEVIGSINDLSTNAAGQATAALDKAKKANELAQSASDTAGPAKTIADEAKSEADTAALKANAVSKKASQIDTGLRETQWAFSARTLQTLSERDKIIEQLKQFQGKTVFVRSYRYMGDVDGFRVCKMVIDLAHSAGMNPVDQCSTLLLGGMPATGIQVCGPNDQEMLSLSKALTPIDMGGTCPWGNAQHSPELMISVGSKALVGIGETFQTEDSARRAAAMKKTSKSNAKR